MTTDGDDQEYRRDWAGIVMAGAVVPQRDETLGYVHVCRVILHLIFRSVSNDDFSGRRDGMLGGQNG